MINPAFIIILVIALILFWFYASNSYKYIGEYFYRLFKEAKDNIEEKEKEKD